MPQPLDAGAVCRWSRLALDALGAAREEIDAINVYPVPDGDTGTNLYLTVESAAQAVAAAEAGEPSLGEAARALAHGALIGARGNSGTILAQLLRGMAEVLAAAPEPATADTLRTALAHAADSARLAVARPVEGTMLTVASAAATAAAATPGDTAAVLTAARVAARAAVAATPEQLPELARAGVVDAGGSGLVTVLDALDAALFGGPPVETPRHRPPRGQVSRVSRPQPCADASHGDPGYEVTFLLDAEDTAIPPLRERLDALGDSLVVVGGDGLWHVHVHTQEAGPAVEAGIAAGRPHRVRITALAPTVAAEPATPRGRAVVAVLPGPGLAGLCAEAGATTLTVRPGERPGGGELAAAIASARAGEVVLLPNDKELWHAAAAAAEQARAEGVRVAVVPTRSPVQGIAALAVHTAERRFDEDVVAMTAAAGATRFGEVSVAERQSWTMAGVCQQGDVLGLVDGDVAVIGGGVSEVAALVLARMLAGGGELVTLVLGADAPAELARELTELIRQEHLGVDTVLCAGHQSVPLLIGVE
ncbi:DAK2 domain-containing protein [Streptomyces profundus]|uniref:DAK2 domain-containing protein n=1 Tax=Streptomyces profundus TaxID=2867410 RepID=UPI001D167ADB|nr:DAK2 domain-containing protein [Streptomyces sp. MA3_2.13]UED86856.1 DAK2 domain-containing protein [Streptomyces sp. MA3_2.13]